jgi:hypothetical protein
LADCDPVNGNSVRFVVSWKGKIDLGALAGQPLRLKFLLRSTELFAFQFQARAK